MYLKIRIQLLNPCACHTKVGNKTLDYRETDMTRIPSSTALPGNNRTAPCTQTIEIEAKRQTTTGPFSSVSNSNTLVTAIPLKEWHHIPLPISCTSHSQPLPYNLLQYQSIQPIFCPNSQIWSTDTLSDYLVSFLIGSSCRTFFTINLTNGSRTFPESCGPTFKASDLGSKPSCLSSKRGHLLLLRYGNLKASGRKRNIQCMRSNPLSF